MVLGRGKRGDTSEPRKRDFSAGCPPLLDRCWHVQWSHLRVCEGVNVAASCFGHRGADAGAC